MSFAEKVSLDFLNKDPRFKGITNVKIDAPLSGVSENQEKIEKIIVKVKKRKKREKIVGVGPGETLESKEEQLKKSKWWLVTKVGKMPFGNKEDAESVAETLQWSQADRLDPDWVDMGNIRVIKNPKRITKKEKDVMSEFAAKRGLHKKYYVNIPAPYIVHKDKIDKYGYHKHIRAKKGIWGFDTEEEAEEFNELNYSGGMWRHGSKLVEEDTRVKHFIVSKPKVTINPNHKGVKINKI